MVVRSRLQVHVSIGLPVENLDRSGRHVSVEGQYPVAPGFGDATLECCAFAGVLFKGDGAEAEGFGSHTVLARKIFGSLLKAGEGFVAAAVVNQESFDLQPVARLGELHEAVLHQVQSLRLVVVRDDQADMAGHETARKIQKWRTSLPSSLCVRL